MLDNSTKEIYLQPGEFYFGSGEKRVRTVLGSCVAITMWHPKLKIGGICHYLLPLKPIVPIQNSFARQLDGKYADGAIEMFMSELRKSGTKPSEYVVKLFGGGSAILAARKPSVFKSVSLKNIEIGRSLVKENGFKIHGEDLGGYMHRVIVFELWSGNVWIKRVEGAA